MRIHGVAETAIDVENVARSADFYQRLFGLRKLQGDEHFCALELPGSAVFLIFQRDSRRQAVHTPGGLIPPHGSAGESHFAFKISRDALDSCAAELQSQGILIESRVDWPRGGASLYFRDPDHHLVELLTPGCWPNY